MPHIAYIHQSASDAPYTQWEDVVVHIGLEVGVGKFGQ